MPFAPLLPSSGLAGWNFLERTLARQTEIFDRSPDIQRDVDYFTENIGNVSTLDDLMGDRRLLRVALGAFGLDEEIDKGAFVRKVLEEGTLDEESFANRLGNANYIEMAKVFTFGDGFFFMSEALSDQLTRQYRDNQFEISLGGVDDDMRQALNFKREIGAIAERDLTEAGGWFQIMASLPLRSVIETAMNLPAGFSQLDLDQQASILADRADRFFGGRGVDVFRDPEKIDEAIRRFHLNRQIAAGPQAGTPGATALTLLAGGIGSDTLANLILSNA